MSTPATQGASIAVLAPYLPYGITMATPRGPAKLVGLNYGSYQCPVETLDGDARIENGAILGGLVQYDYVDCLPMLRSFADLCTPLADGTVPAEVIMRKQGRKTMAGETIHFYKSQYGAERIEWRVGDQVVMHNGTWLSLYPEFVTGEFAQKWAIDYLRSQHFAVGLEPHQYIRKTN